jgi:hypothetical protein
VKGLIGHSVDSQTNLGSEAKEVADTFVALGENPPMEVTGEWFDETSRDRWAKEESEKRIKEINDLFMDRTLWIGSILNEKKGELKLKAELAQKAKEAGLF